MPPKTSDSAQAAESTAAAESTDAAETAAAAESTDAAETAAAAESTDAAESAEAAESTGVAERPRRSLRVPALLGAAAIVLGTFGVYATVTAHSLRANSAGQNVALTDAAATAAVRRETAGAVNTIFSYNYADTAPTRRSAQHLLTGAAVRQYDRIFALVEKEAPAQKLVVTTRVVSSGVEFLTGGHARVLMFANQQDTRAGTKQTSYAGAMFAVTAVRAGGSWKIENIDTFTGRA